MQSLTNTDLTTKVNIIPNNSSDCRKQSEDRKEQMSHGRISQANEKDFNRSDKEVTEIPDKKEMPNK